METELYAMTAAAAAAHDAITMNRYHLSDRCNTTASIKIATPAAVNVNTAACEKKAEEWRQAQTRTPLGAKVLSGAAERR